MKMRVYVVLLLVLALAVYLRSEGLYRIVIEFAGVIPFGFDVVFLIV